MLHYLYTECEGFHPAHLSVTINASHNLVVYVGDDLSIACVVTSWSYSESKFLTWLKNGHGVYYDSSSPPTCRVCYSASLFDKVHCQQIITLNIKNLTFNDSGNYSCVVRISYYSMVNDTMLITITVPMKQPTANHKSLILKISIPVSVVIILLVFSLVVGAYYY